MCTHGERRKYTFIVRIILDEWIELVKSEWLFYTSLVALLDGGTEFVKSKSVFFIICIIRFIQRDDLQACEAILASFQAMETRFY